MVYSGETADVITIVTNATTYDSQVSQLTCFVEKQGNATFWQQAMNHSQERNWFRAGNRLWLKDTALGNTVSAVADSEQAYT